MTPKIPNPKIIFTGETSGFLAKATREGNIKVSKLFEDAPPHIKGAIWQHELGHISLGHHAIDRKAFNAAQKLQLELEADRFAAKAGSDIKAALQFAIESNASPHGRRVLKQRLKALEDTPRYVYMARAAQGFGQQKFEAVLPKLKNFASRKNAIFAGAMAGGIAGVALLAGAVTSPDSKEKFDPTSVKGISPIPRKYQRDEQASWLSFLFGKGDKRKKLNTPDEDRVLSPELEYKIFADYKISDIEYRKYLEKLKNAQKEESSMMTLKTEDAREALDKMIWWKDPHDVMKVKAKFAEKTNIGQGGSYNPSSNELAINALLNPNQMISTLNMYHKVFDENKLYDSIMTNRILGFASPNAAESTVLHEGLHAVWDINIDKEEKMAFYEEALSQFKREKKEIDRETDVFNIASKAPVYGKMAMAAWDTVHTFGWEEDNPYVEWMANEMFAHRGVQNVYFTDYYLPENKKLQDITKEYIRWSGDKERFGKKFITPMVSGHRRDKEGKLVKNEAYSEIFEDEITRREINKAKDRQGRLHDQDFSMMFSQEGIHPGFSNILKDQSTSGTWATKAHSQFGSGYQGNSDMNFEKQIQKRFDETMSNGMSEQARTKQLKDQFRWYSAALEKFGEASGTGHKRILISKEVLDEQELKRLGFMKVKIAIPEAGQDQFESYRHPDSLFHIHSFEKTWTMHKDEHHSSTMMMIRMKRRRQREREERAKKRATGGKMPERDVFDKIGAWAEDAWETTATFAQGMPHIVTEGLPGIYYYVRGRITGARSMASRLQEEIDPRFFELQNMVVNKLAETNTAYNETEGLHPASEGMGTESVREHSEFGSGYRGPSVWDKISSSRHDFWYSSREEDPSALKDIIQNERLFTAYQGKGSLNSAIAIMGIKQRYTQRKVNKLSQELNDLRNSRSSHGQGLHPFSNGLGAGQVRYYSDFGSEYQGPNDLIQEYLAGPAKILAGSVVGSAISYNLGNKKLAAAIGIFGAAAGLSGMISGREMLEGIDESILPTLVSSAGAIASGTALGASVLSKNITYEETLTKAFGKQGGKVFKKVPYAFWMAGNAADIVTADSFKEAAWESGEFTAQFAGWKAGQYMYEKYAKKAIDSKFLGKISHKGLPGIAVHLAGLAGSKLLTGGYKASVNKPIESIEGLHPGSEGIGTQVVRDTSDFGSIIKALFNRSSLKAAKAATTETISAPAQKLIAVLKGGGSQKEMLERAYESIGARRMTNSLEFVEEMRGKKIVDADALLDAGKIDIKEYKDILISNTLLRREAEEAAAQGFTSAPSRGLVYVGKERADANAQMMSEFHELLEVGHFKMHGEKPGKGFGSHLTKGVIEDEALIRMVAGKETFEAGQTFRMLEGGTRHSINQARSSYKKTESALTKLRNSKKASKEAIEAKEYATSFMRYKLETLEIYKGTPERYKRLASIIEGIHPNTDNSIGADIIRKHSDFGSGFQQIFGLIPKQRLVKAGYNRLKKDHVREEAIEQATERAEKAVPVQKDIVKHKPTAALNDTQLAIKRNKKFREVSTAAVGAGLRAAHNAGKGHRNFSSTMPA